MEINWISVIKNGNPKKDGEYLVTYIDGTGNPKVTIQRWQTGRWWFDGKYTIVVAYADNLNLYDNCTKSLTRRLAHDTIKFQFS